LRRLALRGGRHFERTCSHHPTPVSALGWRGLLTPRASARRRVRRRTGMGSSGRRLAAAPSHRMSCGLEADAAGLNSSGSGLTRRWRSWTESARAGACAQSRAPTPNSPTWRRGSPTQLSTRIGRVVSCRRPGAGAGALPRRNRAIDVPWRDVASGSSVPIPPAIYGRRATPSRRHPAPPQARL
jgi:hypothetical protein